MTYVYVYIGFTNIDVAFNDWLRPETIKFGDVDYCTFAHYTDMPKFDNRKEGYFAINFFSNFSIREC